MAIEDRFPGHPAGTGTPRTRAAAVTPSDSADLPFRTTALLAGGAGVIAVHMQGASSAVNLPIAAGVLLPVRVDRVLATNTTATGIVALD